MGFPTVTLGHHDSCKVDKLTRRLEMMPAYRLAMFKSSNSFLSRLSKLDTTASLTVKPTNYFSE